MKTLYTLTALAAAAMLFGCDDHRPTSDEVQHKQQEQISLQGSQQVGMPAITNFAEKRMMKDILELRDQNKATTTYIVDMNGKFHKVCDSVGYGLPYATQYTNPQRVLGFHEAEEHGNIALPQADPNGLFSPPSADGTWVLCVNHKTGKPEPLYIEPRVIVSPFPLDQ